MPLIIPQGLPAYRALEEENVFVMHRARAMSQDIRPLRILLVNLMPTKIVTETQLARLLANSPPAGGALLLHMGSHESTHVPPSHLQTFYRTFDEVKRQRFDGMIVTGAPVETLAFEQVDYWPELCRVFEFSKTNVYSTLHVCWGAQAALYYHYGIPKYELAQKVSGVFAHRVLRPANPLVRGFDEVFWAPHSRHTEVRRADVERQPALRILAESEGGRPAPFKHRFRQAHFHSGAYGIRPRHPARRVRAGCGARAARCAAKALFCKRRPGPAGHLPLAQPRAPAVFELAELLCVPGYAV